MLFLNHLLGTEGSLLFPQDNRWIKEEANLIMSNLSSLRLLMRKQFELRLFI